VPVEAGSEMTRAIRWNGAAAVSWKAARRAGCQGARIA